MKCHHHHHRRHPFITDITDKTAPW